MRPLPRLADELRIGLMVLTRLPAGRISGAVPEVGASAWGWPVVGLAVGAIAAAVWGFGNWAGLPPHVAAALAVLASVFVTGGLHEDGLADLADGFGGGRDREHRLMIMRDSRIGSYGALAIGFSLLFRVAALGSLSCGSGAVALMALAAASRAALPFALSQMPPARDDGLGRAARQVSDNAVCVAAALGLAALAFAGLFAGLATGFVMAATGFGLAVLAMRRIGGQTGDVLGALQQVTELAGWVALSALL